jgi:hypothetical protein
MQIRNVRRANRSVFIVVVVVVVVVVVGKRSIVFRNYLQQNVF